MDEYLENRDNKETRSTVLIAGDMLYLFVRVPNGEVGSPGLQCYDLKARKQLWGLSDHPDLMARISGDFNVQVATSFDITVFDLFTGSIELLVYSLEVPKNDPSIYKSRQCFDSDGNCTVTVLRESDSMESFLVMGKVAMD